MNINHI